LNNLSKLFHYKTKQDANNEASLDVKSYVSLFFYNLRFVILLFGVCDFLFAMNFVSEGFRSFCEQTTLHGWQYIGGSSETATKFKLYFWAVIVCLSMVTAGIFLYYNTWVGFELVLHKLGWFISCL
jgi:hypothetical protein